MTEVLEPVALKTRLRNPIVEIFEAATYLDAAVSAHLAGDYPRAASLIRLADMPVIADWSESLWGSGLPWAKPLPVENPVPFVPKGLRPSARMPTAAETRALLARDGFRCRFCGIPLIRAETRSRIRNAYPDALRWGGRNSDQHAAFQAMWLQYDHVIPHARGGTNELNNLVVTCAPCNNARSNLTLEEVGLADPRERDPLHTTWDGLERFARKGVKGRDEPGQEA
jgi:hypothetical protein